MTYNQTRSQEAFEQARPLMPGGVNSPVRAYKSVGMTPIFAERGEGSRVYDIDGNEYIDYVLSWGPLITGHAHPKVVEAAVFFHQARQHDFPGMAERRMTQVVRQADGLAQVFVATQGAGKGAADLSHFDGVSETCAVIVAFVVDKDLCLVFHATKGPGVDDAVAVALEGGAIIWLVIEVGAAFAVLAAHPVGRQAFVLDLFQLLAGEKHDFLCRT